MEKVNVESFNLIGISVRTTNENGQSGKDIAKLWEKFMADNLIKQIPNKIDPSILSTYTNYEGDHTQPYDAILGCRVSTLDEIPRGMVGITCKGGKYSKFIFKGNLTKGLVYEAWTEIWQAGLKRAFSADFEVYGEKAQDRTNAEVEIFVSLKE